MVSSYMPDCMIRVLFKGIKIASDGSFKQGRILWDDTETGAQIMKTNCEDIDVVYDDFPTSRFNQAEQSLNQSRFATSSASNNPNLLPTRKCAVYTMKNNGKALLVTNLLEEHGKCCQWSWQSKNFILWKYWRRQKENSFDNFLMGHEQSSNTSSPGGIHYPQYYML